MLPDFTNTEIAFTSKSDRELKKLHQIFTLMNNPAIVKTLSSLGMLAVKFRLPFHETIIKRTMFEIFCGGTSLLDSQSTIEQLGKHNVSAALDYGAEGKTLDEDLDRVADEVCDGIRFAASNDTVPVVITKMTALAPNELLESMNKGDDLTSGLLVSHDRLLSRLSAIGDLASELNVRVFIDAEETWMQDAIDQIVRDMMREYNKTGATIYTTYQLYLKDGLERMLDEYERSQTEGFMLGAKIVRGAYMEKERERALELGMESPIHDQKADCDRDFDLGVRHCVRHYTSMASCAATHNLQSSLLQARLIEENQIARNHPHLNFCQLLGMSDYITYNLAAAGYNAGKYLVYGSVKDVFPYLVRRAQENSSISGELSRELQLIKTEMNRRQL